MGGAVSAEHGVGKIKRGFLETMYGPVHIREMARLKCQLDPKGQLGRGNLFGEELLDEMVAERLGARDAGGWAGTGAGADATSGTDATAGANAVPADAEKSGERA